MYVLQSMHSEPGFQIAPIWSENGKMTMTSQFVDMKSLLIFFDVILFLLSSLVTGPSFMSISSLVLELWQFSFIRDWPEIRKLEIPPSEFCLISGDWGELGIPNVTRMSLIKFYWMQQNARVTDFPVLELLRENQQGGKISPHPDLGFKLFFFFFLIGIHYMKDWTATNRLRHTGNLFRKNLQLKDVC